jgi:hypothetical protein
MKAKDNKLVDFEPTDGEVHHHGAAQQAIKVVRRLRLPGGVFL